MPGAGVRALARTVFFHDLRDPCTILGGLVLTPGITNSNFYFMLGILLVITSNTYFLRNDHGEKVPRDSQPLHPGNYAIVTDGTLTLIDEAPLLRTTSRITGTRTKIFTEQVRLRDQRCVISKVENPRATINAWTAFEAAHIFPPAYEEHWIACNYGRCITLPPSRGGTINSVQNGLLLKAHIHQLFDTYMISINPDDNYKIVCFQSDIAGVAGTYLDRRLLDNAQRPADELLRWHFRQAILTNMRGAGEPTFEHDLPPGSDIMGDIRNGPQASKRMEFARFAAYRDLSRDDDTNDEGREV